MQTEYISIFVNSFGLFQYFFRKLVLVLPIFAMIAFLILLFYMCIKK